MGTELDPAGSIWNELEESLRSAGLSIQKFAQWYEGELNELPDQDAIERRVEKLKKQIMRKSATKAALSEARAYLNVLHRHSDYIQRVGIAPRSIEYPELSHRERDGLKKISRLIDEQLDNQVDPEE